MLVSYKLEKRLFLLLFWACIIINYFFCLIHKYKSFFSLILEFPLLEDINVSRCRVGDLSIVVLSRSEVLAPNLKKLHFDSTKVTDKSLSYIPSKKNYFRNTF